VIKKLGNSALCSKSRSKLPSVGATRKKKIPKGGHKAVFWMRSIQFPLSRVHFNIIFLYVSMFLILRYRLIIWISVFEMQTDAQLLITFLLLYGTQRLVACSQKPATAHNPEPKESRPNPPNLLPYDPLSYPNQASK
jgi:hypothetical protein